MNMDFSKMTDAEFIAARQKFFESHKEAPVAKEVECLNLIMRKEFAEQILAGTKKLEYRAYSEHYVSRLVDKDVCEYINMHKENDEVLAFCNDIRQVKKIHFHNYSNSWYLDVEVDFNDCFSLTKADVEFLQKEYGVHDWDEELARFEARKEQYRPFFFYFVIGKVLGTNLK